MAAILGNATGLVGSTVKGFQRPKGYTMHSQCKGHKVQGTNTSHDLEISKRIAHKTSHQLETFHQHHPIPVFYCTSTSFKLKLRIPSASQSNGILYCLNPSLLTHCAPRVPPRVPSRGRPPSAANGPARSRSRACADVRKRSC